MGLIFRIGICIVSIIFNILFTNKIINITYTKSNIRIDNFQNIKRKFLFIETFITILFFIKFTLINLIFLDFLIIFLTISSFFDYTTSYVFSIYCYITTFISLSYVFFAKIFFKIDITYVIISIVLFYIFCYFENKFKMQGEGDTEFLVSIAPFISIIHPYFSLEFLFLMIIIATVLLLLFNLKNFNVKKMKLKKGKPYVPYLSFATLIILLI